MKRTVKTWCQHIYMTTFFGYAISIHGQGVCVPDDWLYCPVCRATKPKPVKRGKG